MMKNDLLVVYFGTLPTLPQKRKSTLDVIAGV
jgi:hypothetical protein